MLISRKKICFDVLKKLCIASRTEVGASWLCGLQLANSGSSNELQHLSTGNSFSPKFDAGSIFGGASAKISSIKCWMLLLTSSRPNADECEAKCVFKKIAVKNDAASARLQ